MAITKTFSDSGALVAKPDGSYRLPSASRLGSFISAVIVFTCLPLFSQVAAGEGRASSQLIWDFDYSLTNSLGGEYRAYGREPSWARTYLDPNVHLLSEGHSLRITAHRNAEGFCGVWLEFFPASSVPRQFLDASPYRLLSFWIKGQKGGEDFDLQLADDTWQKHPDSNPTRPLHAYLPKGATTQWQEVLIPLADFIGLNPRRLVGLTLNFATPGDYRVYLDNLALKPSESTPVPTPKRSATELSDDAPEKTHRAMWVWKTQDLFEHPEAMKRFFEFCIERSIREIYLSLILNRRAAPEGLRFDLQNPDRYREFLGRAHQDGFVVEGLAGTPEWAVRENHSAALAAVDTVLVFNRSSPSDARFDGLHFDVEPYSLPGYSDREYRTQLLSEFLEMMAQCAARVRTESNLRFSCDVPAWFYPVGALGRQELLVTFKGEEKTVGEHLTDLLDTVTIMDYHNQADGAGGVIAAGIPPLTYAALRGKKLMVGLETSFESEFTVYFVCGLPAEEFSRRLGASEFRNLLFLGDFRLFTFSDDINVHVGLAAPSAPTDPMSAELEGSLLRLARQLGAASDPDRFPADPILDEARSALAQNPEWKGFERFELTDPELRRTITGFRSLHQMSGKVTFRGLGREVFDEETRSIVEWLRRYPSFAGLAFHFYDSFRSLMEGQ